VHAEGRAAKGLVETARAQVAEALGAGEADIIFTSGATEACGLALAGRGLSGAAVEHDAVAAWVTNDLAVDGQGRVALVDSGRSAVQLANSETGVVQDLPPGLAFSDITQGVGRVPFAYSWAGVQMVALSAHKCGGPKGVGALVIPRGHDLTAQLRGGGQEMGRRAGTENITGIAGMGAAITAALRDLADGVWDRVAQVRDEMEQALLAAAPDAVIAGLGAARLPNTTCIATPDWKGETQVMVMDLAGFAVSAGSACSSGKVRASRVLTAMGLTDLAPCALRISLGPDTTREDALRFADTWSNRHRARRLRAA
jgi:cysteine desulfurase